MRKKRILSLILAAILVLQPCMYASAKEDTNVSVETETEIESALEEAVQVEVATEEKSASEETDSDEQESALAGSENESQAAEPAKDTGSQKKGITAELTVEEELEDSLTAKGAVSDSRRGRSLVQTYNGCFGEQLDELSRKLYDVFVSYYVTGKSTGNCTCTFDEPLTFEAQVEDNTIVKNEAFLQIENLINMSVQSAIDAFLYDHPEAYWIRGGIYRYTVQVPAGSSEGIVRSIVFMPEEIYDGASKSISAFDAAVTQTVNQIKSQAGSSAGRYDILKCVHDYLCNSLYYNISGEFKTYSAEPAFIGDKGVVCEGYAKTLKILCDKLDIPCACISGYGVTAPGEGEGHMWNYVQMEDGKWYLIDATWDDQDDYMFYNYFLAGADSKGFISTVGGEHQERTDFSLAGYMNFTYPVLSGSAYSGEEIPAPHLHTFRTEITKNETCGSNGIKTTICEDCDYEKTETIPATGQHSFGAYKITKSATVFAAGTKTRTCSVCDKKENITIKKLTPTIKLNASSITLKTKQSTTKIKVSNLAAGDKVKSWKSSNTKIVKVTNAGKITAQGKTGTATLTVTLASGKTAKVKVKVQRSAVKTTKISGLSKKVTLQKGKKTTLKPVISPLTSVQKITYKTSNKKVVTVSSKGVITAKKKGTAKITVKSGSKKYVVTVVVK